VPECWADWVVRPEEGIVLVALVDETVVGTCYIHFLTDGQCWFQALRVHPGHRRAGVGSALTERALTEAHHDGRRVAYLGIDADNPASLTMTARAGFRQITAYRRLHADVSSGSSIGSWRTATADDAPLIFAEMSMQAERCGYPQAFFMSWEWQELSPAAISSAIERQGLWIWESDNAVVVAGLDFYDEEVGLFAPAYLRKVDLVNALQALPPLAMEKGAKRLELWLPFSDQSITELIEHFGFRGEPDDGYTIWSYTLR
ncbi:MAG: N-acetyltransferase family protein, partial [Bacillota bacterium]